MAQPGVVERTRVRREAAMLRALRGEGVEGIAALLGACGTTYVFFSVTRQITRQWKVL